jgi:hypothetical protein
MFKTNSCKITKAYLKQIGYNRHPWYPMFWEQIPSDTYQITNGIFILLYTIPAELKYLLTNKNEKLSDMFKNNEITIKNKNFV